MTNTEKPSTKAEQKKKGVVKTPKTKEKIPQLKNAPKKDKKENNEKSQTPTEKAPEKVDKKDTEKKEKKKEVKIKKEFAVTNAKDIPISTKQAVAICKFIVGKPIQKAINELEEVTKLKIAIPMKGEIPHRKGKIMSGRFPLRASKQFIKILKELQGNSNQNNVDEPIIKEAIANKAQRPYGRFGSHKKKRSHIKIIVFEKSSLKKKKTKEKKK
ncbi:hypothetical protein B6U91_01330 [Candidatus Pacearchaeota archaeon ex4484_71]|nr:MAG: hypothetical protein B6U91_01330 [Candidatus Pacearchaeota archaeon ex4484_71]